MEQKLLSPLEGELNEVVLLLLVRAKDVVAIGNKGVVAAIRDEFLLLFNVPPMMLPFVLVFVTRMGIKVESRWFELELKGEEV